MAHTQRWSVEIDIVESRDRTTAEARLRIRDATDVRGHGHALRNPHDRPVPEIGAELAAARALADLSRQVFDATVVDIERATGDPVEVSG